MCPHVSLCTHTHTDRGCAHLGSEAVSRPVSPLLGPEGLARGIALPALQSRAGCRRRCPRLHTAPPPRASFQLGPLKCYFTLTVCHSTSPRPTPTPLPVSPWAPLPSPPPVAPSSFTGGFHRRVILKFPLSFSLFSGFLQTEPVEPWLFLRGFSSCPRTASFVYLLTFHLRASAELQLRKSSANILCWQMDNEAPRGQDLAWSPPVVHGS